MRSLPYLATLVATVVAAGCTEHVDVSSASAPNLDTSPYHTFALMPADSGRPEIRKDLEHSFTGRGYSVSANPDLLVAYYGGTGDIIKVKTYPYGYTGMSNVAKMNVTDYPAGTLIVDVVDARTNQLVWRGQGVSRIPSDTNLYSRQIEIAVRNIVAQFPKAGKAA